MTHFYIREAVLLFVFWVVFVQIKHWARWRALKNFGDENGCGDMPTVLNKLPGGLDRAIKMLTNGKPNFDLLMASLFPPP
jgi:hypothetical protein